MYVFPIATELVYRTSRKLIFDVVSFFIKISFYIAISQTLLSEMIVSSFKRKFMNEVHYFSESAISDNLLLWLASRI
jgi:hypothetical protein